MDSASCRTDFQFGRRGPDVRLQNSALPFDSRYYWHHLAGDRVHGNDLRISGVDRVETTQVCAAGGYQVSSQFSGHRRLCHWYGIAVLWLPKEVDILYGESGVRRRCSTYSYGVDHDTISERRTRFSLQTGYRFPKITLHFCLVEEC